MARRRLRPSGDGMTPLFDLESLTPRGDDPSFRVHARRESVVGPSSASAMPYPVPYWIRGVFRFGGGEERTRSVEGQAMHDKRDTDIIMFIAWLQTEGWFFPEGRAVMVELLGIGAHDGTDIYLSQHAAE